MEIHIIGAEHKIPIVCYRMHLAELHIPTGPIAQVKGLSRVQLLALTITKGNIAATMDKANGKYCPG